jgi:hypothetical protein
MGQTMQQVIAETQGYLNTAGFPCGANDGIWGPRSQSALESLKSSTKDTTKPYGVSKLFFGVKFGDAEIAKLAQVVQRLGLDPVFIQDFMACMAWETGEQFSPSTSSPVSSATGLIQFMKATAIGLGTTTDQLSKMSVVEQLEYVYKYFKPYAKRIKETGDVYMVILWPAGVGQPDSYVLWKQGDPAFAPNGGLDVNKDGIITRQECLHKVNNKMARGAQPQFIKAL